MSQGIGPFIAERMEALGLNQTTLAARANEHMPPGGKFTQSYISGLVHGKILIPGPVRLLALARALGTTPARLREVAGVPDTPEPDFGSALPADVVRWWHSTEELAAAFSLSRRDIGDDAVWRRYVTEAYEEGKPLTDAVARVALKRVRARFQREERG